jgi:hypothetical protein
VKGLVNGAPRTEVPELVAEPVDLGDYDALLEGVGA